MTIKVGDAVFMRSGQPVLVKGRRPENGELVVEPELKAVQKDMRHGYLNGLSENTRQELYEILDKTKSETKDPGERVEALKAKLDEIEGDPTRQQLASYLRAELVHIMNTHRIRPKEYSVPEIKVR